jgi:hypothetical protein
MDRLLPQKSAPLRIKLDARDFRHESQRLLTWYRLAAVLSQLLIVIGPISEDLRSLSFDFVTIQVLSVNR